MTIRSGRLTTEDFWTSYQDMIEQFDSLSRREDENKRDLTEIRNALDDRMEDMRQTFHDLYAHERVPFYTIAKDLLPVTIHVNTDELDNNVAHQPAKCIACNQAFSRRLQEPATPNVAHYSTTKNRVQQVHTPTRYQECATAPHQHAFCMREWARYLMGRDENNNITGNLAYAAWRCTMCAVDPWRAG